MKPFKAICLGVALWMVMFVLVSVFIAFGLYGQAVVKSAVAMIAGFIALALVVYARPKNLMSSLGYGVTWVIVGLFLDLLITWRFNENIFYEWSVWVGYGFVLLASLLGFFSIENGNGESESEEEPKPPTDIKI